MPQDESRTEVRKHAVELHCSVCDRWWSSLRQIHPCLASLGPERDPGIGCPDIDSDSDTHELYGFPVPPRFVSQYQLIRADLPDT
jgi:hypothetical protein